MSSLLLTFDVLNQGTVFAAAPVDKILISFYDGTLDAAARLYQQIETAIVVGTITGSGNVTVTVTAAGMTGSPKTISVAVLLGDVDAVVAAKIRKALVADSVIGAFFVISGTKARIILTRVTPATNDATMNVSITNGTCAGLTNAPTSYHGMISDEHGAVMQPTLNVAAKTNIRSKAIYQGMANYCENRTK